jgi:hypothetical protein
MQENSTPRKYPKPTKKTIVDRLAEGIADNPDWYRRYSPWFRLKVALLSRLQGDHAARKNVDDGLLKTLNVGLSRQKEFIEFVGEPWLDRKRWRMRLDRVLTYYLKSGRDR